MKSTFKGFTVEEISLPVKSGIKLSPDGHSCTIHADRPITICFDQDFVDEILGCKNFTFTEQSIVTDPFLSDIASKLISICDDAFAEKIYAESLGVVCIGHLAKQYCSRDVQVPKGRLDPYLLKQVVDFAYSYMHFNIGLHEMAGIVHLSPYHFGRLFKQTVGKSPYQFILQLKIDCAKKMMRKNRGPIGDIAFQLNFSDQSHFSNAFRKATGVSPREFQGRSEEVKR